MSNQQDQSRHRDAKNRADLTRVDDICFQETGNAIHVVIVETDVVIAEQIDLGTGYAACFEVVLNLF